jgi:hypothetical protein
MINFRIKILVAANNLNKNKKANLSIGFLLLVAGTLRISNLLEGYELVVDLWKYMNRRDD